MGGPSHLCPVNQACRGSAGSHSSAGGPFLPREEAEEWVMLYSSQICIPYTALCQLDSGTCMH